MRHLFFCLMMLGLAGPITRSAAAGESSADLRGVWIFEKEVDTRADGTVVKLPMPRYEGVLIYTADGFVSANLMPRDRRWTLDSATRADLMGSVGEGASTAYAGRYEVDRVTKTVTHTPITSVDPGDVGRKLTRQYSVRGDELLLTGKFQHEGQELQFTVYWKRATAASKAGG